MQPAINKIVLSSICTNNASHDGPNKKLIDSCSVT